MQQSLPYSFAMWFRPWKTVSSWSQSLHTIAKSEELWPIMGMSFDWTLLASAIENTNQDPLSRGRGVAHVPHSPQQQSRQECGKCARVQAKAVKISILAFRCQDPPSCMALVKHGET